MQLKGLRTLILAAAGFALLALPVSGRAQGLMVTGYADLEAVFNDIDSDDADFYFDNHHFNVIAMGKLSDDMFAAAEIEFEHGGEEIKLEYGYLAYTGFKNFKIAGGKFIVPFGRFNKDLHPTWINKMQDRPHGFSQVLPQTYSDVGVWISGAVPMGRGNRFVYDAYVVNGLLGDDGGSIRSMRDNDREKTSDGGRDDNKAVGTRVGVEFAPAAFDIGFSVYSGNYLNVADSTLTLTLVGFDAAYRYGDLELRGEYVAADQEATDGSLDKKGGYVQAAYRLAPKFEPVVRYSARDMPGDADDASRVSVGANFYVGSNSTVRVAYHANSEDKTEFEKENNAFTIQFNVTY